MKSKIVYLLFFAGLLSYGQKDDKAEAKALRASKDLTWDANKKLSENDFPESEADYRKAIAKSDKNVAAPYNLGNAYYKNKSYSEAFSRYKQAGEIAPDKNDKHNAFHNMGNVFMERKEYEKAVEAYKQALRNNPTDDETRYNLALAKEMLKKQQDEDNKNDKNKDDKDKKDQENKDDKEKNQGDNKDENKDQDQNKDNEDKGDKGDEKKEDNKQEEGDEKKDEQQQPDSGDKPEEQRQQTRPNQLSPQQIRNLLEATQNEEKKVQEKMDAQKVQGPKIKTEKDW